ncbi:MAG: hypothetical protein CMI17_08640 [Opitutaceae bacterium]|mgnify:CR=1 FL=1|nr:hypothetical protein [Opitutaceae bacterium]
MANLVGFGPLAVGVVGVWVSATAFELGKLTWESTEAVEPDRFATLHIVVQGDNGKRVWIFNEHGELIIADLSPAEYKQISRGRLVPRTPLGMPARIGGVTWAHPAFASKHVIARNDKQLVCADLNAE